MRARPFKQETALPTAYFQFQRRTRWEPRARIDDQILCRRRHDDLPRRNVGQFGRGFSHTHFRIHVDQHFTGPYRRRPARIRFHGDAGPRTVYYGECRELKAPCVLGASCLLYTTHAPETG